MTHTPLDARLRSVADATGATCTWRIIGSHADQRIQGLYVEVLELAGQLTYVNPITGHAEALTVDQCGQPITRR